MNLPFNLFTVLDNGFIVTLIVTKRMNDSGIFGQQVEKAVLIRGIVKTLRDKWKFCKSKENKTLKQGELHKRNNFLNSIYSFCLTLKHGKTFS